MNAPAVSHSAWPRTLARHILVAIGTLLLLSIITFGATSLRPPAEVARAAQGRDVAQAQLDAFIEEHGLDRPVPVRYVSWLTDFVRGDFGDSPITHRTVASEVLPRVGRTILLASIALLITLPVAIGLGIFMARREGSFADLSILTWSVVLAATPEFVIGALLVLVLGVWLGALPVDSTAIQFGTFAQKAEAYVLPALTLLLSMLPYIARMTRAAVRETLGAPYVQAALLRGVPRRTIMRAYVMRNAAILVINAIAVNVVYLLGGVVVVENLFAFPGIGQELVHAIGAGDVVSVQAVGVLLGAMFVVTNLLADLAGVWLNPRLRPQS